MSVRLRGNLAGRLKFFQENWKLITSDLAILEIVRGWRLPIIGRPFQEPKQIPMSEVKREVVDKEIQSMIQKGALREVQPVEGQYLSTIFVRPKREMNKFRPIINLKQLNTHMPYRHFKMEGMKDVIDLLNQGDYMMKIDLKDAYWHIPIHPSSQKYLRFQWKEKLYEMLVLAFGVGPGPRIFTKLLKVPLTILRRLMIEIVAYLDDLLIIEKTMEGAIRARDTVLFLLQRLGFTIN